MLMIETLVVVTTEGGYRCQKHLLGVSNNFRMFEDPSVPYMTILEDENGKTMFIPHTYEWVTDVLRDSLREPNVIYVNLLEKYLNEKDNDASLDRNIKRVLKLIPAVVNPIEGAGNEIS